ncbi:hypothetical protein A2U01_0119143, partial [Trifolium medium]|nr:hypothetical protein [Trifolium medium]
VLHEILAVLKTSGIRHSSIV